MPASSGRASETKREVRSTFDFISHDYDKLRSHVWEDLASFTAESLFSTKPRRDALILDLACGNARHAIYFTEEHRVKSVAVDFSSQLLKLARSRVKSSSMQRIVALINGDASNVPLRNQSVDYVLYIAAVHHLPTTSERLKSIRETSRVLGDRGRAVVTVWRKWQRRFASHFIKKHFGNTLGDRLGGELGDIYVPWGSDHGMTSVSRFYHLFSKRELSRLLSKAGFRIIRIVKSSKKTGEGSFFACIEKR